MDIKLKDILSCVKTWTTLRLDNQDNGEKFYPSYSEITSYGDYYITEIEAAEDKLIITIKEQI